MVKGPDDAEDPNKFPVLWLWTLSAMMKFNVIIDKMAVLVWRLQRLAHSIRNECCL